MQKQQYQKIVTGDFYWKGNLERYYQHTQVKVMPAAVDIRGKRLDAKIIIESWLEDRNKSEERDHFSIRIQSIGEFFSLLTSLILALRIYLRFTPSNPIYIYGKVINKFKEVWQGHYDFMIKE